MEGDCDAVGDADAVSGGGGTFSDRVCVMEAEVDSEADGDWGGVCVLLPVSAKGTVDEGDCAAVGTVAVIGMESEGLEDARRVTDGAGS